MRESFASKAAWRSRRLELLTLSSSVLVRDLVFKNFNSASFSLDCTSVADGNPLSNHLFEHSSLRGIPHPAFLRLNSWLRAPLREAQIAIYRARFAGDVASIRLHRLCSSTTGSMSTVTTRPFSTTIRPLTTVYRALCGAQNTVAATGS